MEKLQFGGTYHVYNRGVNRCNLFYEKANYLYFLRLFADHIAPVVQVFAYCLLPNHFHILLRLLEADEILSRDDLHDYWQHARDDRPHQYFSNCFNAYARTINDRYGRSGSLFQRPFHRKPVTTDDYFCTLITYIHRNPQKHRLVDDFRDWPYSSYDAILHEKPTRVERTAVLDYFGNQVQFLEAHQTEPDETKLQPWLGEDDD